MGVFNEAGSFIDYGSLVKQKVVCTPIPNTPFDYGRSCYIDQEVYRRYNNTVQRNLGRVCQSLVDTLVDIDGVFVPKTTPKIAAAGITGGKTVLNIVGDSTAPTYGCGAGYAKGVQGLIFVWALNTITPLKTALLVCGSLQLILVFLAFVITFGGGFNIKKETSEEAYARYMEEIHNSNSNKLNNSAVATARVEDEFEQGNPNRMSVQNGAPMVGNRLSMQSSHTQRSNNPVAEVPVDFNVDDKI
jgi:hypothetical protein